MPLLTSSPEHINCMQENLPAEKSVGFDNPILDFWRRNDEVCSCLKVADFLIGPTQFHTTRKPWIVRLSLLVTNVTANITSENSMNAGNFIRSTSGRPLVPLCSAVASGQFKIYRRRGTYCLLRTGQAWTKFVTTERVWSCRLHNLRFRKRSYWRIRTETGLE